LFPEDLETKLTRGESIYVGELQVFKLRKR
jgi:hypothetical protein